jgi:hypothetical protein
MSKAFTVRYHGSLPEYRNNIACAVMEGEWTGPETTRYTLTIWDGRGVLRNVRRQSIETGGVTIWADSPCICRCGGEHNRYPH